MYDLLAYTYNVQKHVYNPVFSKYCFYNEMYYMYEHVHTFMITSHKLKHGLYNSFSFYFIFITFLYNIINKVFIKYNIHIFIDL